jgi:uncharacterized protein (DUF3084 family)
MEASWLNQANAYLTIWEDRHRKANAERDAARAEAQAARAEAQAARAEAEASQRQERALHALLQQRTEELQTASNSIESYRTAAAADGRRLLHLQGLLREALLRESPDS